jgi:hypothetical protein
MLAAFSDRPPLGVFWVTDFIEEVDEDLRRDQYKKLWDKYGKYVIAAVVALVLGVAGTVVWRDWQKSRRVEETRKVAEAIQLTRTDPKLGADALASLGRSASIGVATLARLQEAATLARQGDVPRAVEVYDRIAADGSVDSLFRDVAVLLASQYRADGPEAAAAALKLAPLAQESSVWRHPALELTAVIALGQGDRARARDIFRRLADDPTAPAGIRARAAEMVAALAE